LLQRASPERVKQRKNDRDAHNPDAEQEADTGRIVRMSVLTAIYLHGHFLQTSFCIFDSTGLNWFFGHERQTSRLQFTKSKGLLDAAAFSRAGFLDAA
jgi:hypothetical protein